MNKKFILHLITLLLIINAFIVSFPSHARGITLTLEAWEDVGGSCPWVFTWDGAEYVIDNDIYSVARYPKGEYTDYYLLQTPLVTQGNIYNLEIREIEREDSWTDFTGLTAVDHASDVAVGTDDKGNISAFRPDELIAPVTAVSNSGSDVNSLINTKDDSGFNAYSEDYIEINFGNVDVSQGARVLLRVKGFISGTGEDMPFIGPPAVIVQTLQGGAWQEIGRLKPRFEWSEEVFDLSPYLPDSGGDRKIRLYTISHGQKYHEIDYVALSTGPEPAFEIKQLALVSAEFNNGDVLNILNYSDNNYLEMTLGDRFSVSFASEPQTLAERDFIFISEGYYIPVSKAKVTDAMAVGPPPYFMNGYEIHTWDGAAWTMRDNYFFDVTDETRTFDLTPFLPDPNGEFKFRIFQTNSRQGAGIDYVSLDIGTWSSATDLRDDSDIMTLVNSSDDIRLTYVDDPWNYDRWTEYEFCAADNDLDMLCDPVDPDDDNDGVLDGDDTNPLDPFVCEDVDADTCDDCAVGTDGFGPLPDNDPFNDGLDVSGDGICNAGLPIPAVNKWGMMIFMVLAGLVSVYSLRRKRTSSV